MQNSTISVPEYEEQAAFNSYKVLKNSSDSLFDDLTLIIAQVCAAPISLILLLDNDRQWVISKFGLNANEIVKDISLWRHALKTPGAFFEVQDAKKDPRFLDTPLVIGKLNLSFFAAVPLVDSSNLIIGSVCVLDYNPKALTVNQKKAFIALGAEVMKRIEVNLKNESLTSEIEKELEVSKSKLFDLYDEAPVVIFSTDPFFKRVTKCNGAASELLGFVKSEMIGKTLLDLFPTSGGEKIEQILKKFIEKGKIENQRLLVRTKRGKDINVAINSKAVRNEKGEITHSTSVLRNIDDLVKAEQKLKELRKDLEVKIAQSTTELRANTKRLELALEGTRDGVWDRADIQSNKEWWSPRFHQLLGYKEGEIEQSYSSFTKNLLHKDELETIEMSMLNCSKNGTLLDIEHRLREKGGNYKWFRARARFSYSKDGVPIRLTGSISDIDRQKRLEIELLETKSFLKKITDIAPSIIYVFNLKKMANEYVNREVGAVLGYSDKEIQDFGSRLHPTLCHPEDLEHVLAHFAVVANLEDDKVASLEYRMKHKDGEYRWLLSEETVFERNDDGSVEKQLGVATDITTLKNIQASLSAKTEKLKVQNADLRQLAYVATHDLKHPIVVLQGHFDYLKKKFVKPSEDIKDSIEFIEDEIKNFNVTLKGLNDAIKVKELRIEKVPLNLTELIKATLPTFKRQVEQLGGKLTTRLLENVVVFGTTVYFQSIIQNLLSNAIEYRSLTEKLEINISTSVDEKGLIFNVEDNGLGMDLVRQKDKLFKMFNHFHHNLEGSGMGLYMVKNMVEKMGGSIKIESEIDKGTKISILFKIAK
jgi:PAS domain S-box-containing protein